MAYDPAFLNTANCRSAITFIDGDKGILEYRGYPIEQLAEKSTYLEVAYLLLNGELPTRRQLDEFTFTASRTTRRAREHQGLHRRVPLRRAPDGHAGAPRWRRCPAFYPEAKNIKDERSRAHADDRA